MVQHQHQIADEDVQWCKALAEVRSKAYWFVSSFFLEAPTADSLQTLRTSLGTRPRDADANTELLFAELEALLESVPDRTQFVRELGIEYTRLFHGLKDGSGLAPPYESVHREGRLIGAMTSAVVNAYAEAGYQCIYEPAGPQDHIGVELRFLALLCFDELQSWSTGHADAIRSNWAQQSNFLTRHVLAWIPAYCEAMEREATGQYYRIVAKLTRYTLEGDHQTLRHLRSQFGLS